MTGPGPQHRRGTRCGWLGPCTINDLGEVSDEKYPHRRRRVRGESPWLEALSPDRRGPDIVRVKALARSALQTGAQEMMAWADRRLWMAARMVIHAGRMANEGQLRMWECLLLTSRAVPATATGPMRWVPSMYGDRLAGSYLPVKGRRPAPVPGGRCLCDCQPLGHIADAQLRPRPMAVAGRRRIAGGGRDRLRGLGDARGRVGGHRGPRLANERNRAAVVQAAPTDLERDCPCRNRTTAKRDLSRSPSHANVARAAAVSRQARVWPRCHSRRTAGRSARSARPTGGRVPAGHEAVTSLRQVRAARAPLSNSPSLL